MATEKQLINPKRVSRTQILADLNAFVDTREDAQVWRDYFKAGAGSTVVELHAGIGAFLSYHAMAARRDTLLNYARLRSSIYGIIDNLGYPPNRKSAPTFEIKADIKETMFWDRTVPIGTIRGMSVSLLKSEHLLKGKNQILQCVGGDWLQVDQTSDNNLPWAEFRYAINDTDTIANGHVEVYIGNVQVPITRYPEELEQGNVLIKTLFDNVSLIFGDGTLGRQARNSEVVELHYVETSVEPESGYALDAFVTDRSLIVATDLTVLDPGAPADSLLKLTRIGPGYFAAKRRMVTTSDHEYLIMSYPGIESAKVNPGYCSQDAEELVTKALCKEAGGEWTRAFECCTIEIAYLYWDEHLMSIQEEDLILDYLDEDHRMQGEQIIFRDPEPVLVDVRVTIVMVEGTDISGFEEEIQRAVDKQMFILGGTFHVADIVIAGNNLLGVVRTYLTRPIADKILPFYKYFKLNSLKIRYSTDVKEKEEFGAAPDSGYVSDAGTGNLQLHVAKGGEGNSGEFDLLIDGEVQGTYTTDIPYNSTGLWDTLNINGLHLTEGEHSIALRPTEANAHLLVNRIVYQTTAKEAEKDGAITRSTGQDQTGAVIFDSYVKMNDGGTITFELDI